MMMMMMMMLLHHHHHAIALKFPKLSPIKYYGET